MLGKIIEIIENQVIIKLDIDISQQPNLVNLHAVFDDGSGKLIIGEIANADREKMVINIVGEIIDNEFIPGSSTKPSFKSNVRLIEIKELEKIFGSQQTVFGQTNLGSSNVYDGYKINVSINEFFNAHFSVLGNSGSGKSCSVASVVQKLFLSNEKVPLNSTLVFFDAYGEYTNAFSVFHSHNNNINYKVYQTNSEVGEEGLLRIPVWLLDVDDLALLLDVDSPSQLPIIEKTLQLVPILTGSADSVIRRKNDIIARALQDILLSGESSAKIRDQVVGILTKFNTPTLNLNTQIVQPGYTRTLKQCLYIDATGKMQEMELVVEFIRAYIAEETETISQQDLNYFYSLADLELALEFALISEGVLKSDRVFDMANVLSVRLHSLVTGENGKYFYYPRYLTREDYINMLTTDENGNKVQLLNFNINYVDDRIAKVMVKIISRMFFQHTSLIKPRGSEAFHIFIEEAHRYVQRDTDINLLGYNIFERIAKEGRKYGMFLALITQRPSELSDTCISQCSNFLILRTLHPADLDYIRAMVPNVSDEILMQLKNLKPGNCMAFGSAFKVPISLHMDLPNPRPLSDNVDLEEVWFREKQNINNNQMQMNNNNNNNMDVNVIMNNQMQINNQNVQQGNMQ